MFPCEQMSHDKNPWFNQEGASHLCKCLLIGYSDSLIKFVDDISVGDSFFKLYIERQWSVYTMVKHVSWSVNVSFFFFFFLVSFTKIVKLICNYNAEINY